MVWLGPLQKSLDSEAPELQVCSLRAFLDRELTGNSITNCCVAGPLQESLDSEASDLQACSMRAFLVIVYQLKRN